MKGPTKVKTYQNNDIFQNLNIFEQDQDQFSALMNLGLTRCFLPPSLPYSRLLRKRTMQYPTLPKIVEDPDESQTSSTRFRNRKIDDRYNNVINLVESKIEMNQLRGRLAQERDGKKLGSQRTQPNTKPIKSQKRMLKTISDNFIDGLGGSMIRPKAKPTQQTKSLPAMKNPLNKALQSMVLSKNISKLTNTQKVAVGKQRG